jgi:hypothetical protein
MIMTTEQLKLYLQKQVDDIQANIDVLEAKLRDYEYALRHNKQIASDVIRRSATVPFTGDNPLSGIHDGDLALVVRMEYERREKLLVDLLRSAIDCGNVMSKALGSDECTVPWDDGIVPEFGNLLHKLGKR